MVRRAPVKRPHPPFSFSVSTALLYTCTRPALALTATNVGTIRSEEVPLQPSSHRAGSLARKTAIRCCSGAIAFANNRRCPAIITVCAFAYTRTIVLQVLLLVLACALLVATMPAEPDEGQTGRSRVSDDQLNMALSDKRYLARQLKCALGEAPCDPVGRRLKSTPSGGSNRRESITRSPAIYPAARDLK